MLYNCILLPVVLSFKFLFINSTFMWRKNYVLQFWKKNIGSFFTFLQIELPNASITSLNTLSKILALLCLDVSRNNNKKTLNKFLNLEESPFVLHLSFIVQISSFRHNFKDIIGTKYSLISFHTHFHNNMLLIILSCIVKIN